IKLPKIFLDSGNPQDTKKAKGLLGFLDGQTTNPSLVAKNPEVQKFIESGKKLSSKELLKFYRDIIGEMEKQIAGAISVEVYADWETKAAEMLKQAENMSSWGRNIYIKFPTIPEGVRAAAEFVKKGGRVNMTLVFDQNQAGAVYAATLPSKQPAFVSPFIGRWDDRGYYGLDLVKNIVKMYRKFSKLNRQSKPHVLVLGASIRTLDHFYTSIFLGADILTIPIKIIYEWLEEERWLPDEHYRPDSQGLKSLVYEDIPYHPDCTKYQIEKKDGSLLDEGLKKFVADWKKLIT
ncbi:hypothetical protein A3F03_01610, partial [Candidatus Roizmanbacteria bacterium RIFCSPHIGHO2_12_FULL_41_11]